MKLPFINPNTHDLGLVNNPSHSDPNTLIAIAIPAPSSMQVPFLIEVPIVEIKRMYRGHGTLYLTCETTEGKQEYKITDYRLIKTDN